MRLPALRRWAALDFHILRTLMLRGWSVLAGVVTLVLVLSFLDPVQQGYYYAFASLIAAQVFFELGLSQVLALQASHETAQLSLDSQGRLEGDGPRLDRLAGLLHWSRRWYGAAALLFVACLAGAGLAFFEGPGQMPLASWAGAWLCLVAATACNLYLSPRLAVLEGCGQVGQVARLRLQQSMLGYGLMWLLLAGGAGLWAMPVVPAVAALVSQRWLSRHSRILASLRRRAPAHSGPGLDWRREILPLQWRIAVSWISGYFIFQLFTPLAFARSGATEAGRLGMALSVFSAVSTLGMSWVNAKMPDLTMHVSRGRRRELDRLFWRVASRAWIFTATASLAVVGLAGLGQHLQWSFMARLASPEVLAALAVATLANTAVFAMASYMRAHREEPMLAVSVASGLLTALAAFFASRSGVLPMIVLYALITLLLTLPWTAWLFRHYAWKDR